MCLLAGLTADAIDVMLHAQPDGSVEFMQRVSTAGPTTFIARAPVGFPAWLRLEQSAALVTASVSRDGTTWTTLATASAGGATPASSAGADDALLVIARCRSGVVNVGRIGVQRWACQLDLYGFWRYPVRARLRLRQIDGGLPKARLKAAEKAPADS